MRIDTKFSIHDSLWGLKPSLVSATKVRVEIESVYIDSIVFEIGEYGITRHRYITVNRESFDEADLFGNFDDALAEISKRRSRQ